MLLPFSREHKPELLDREEFELFEQPPDPIGLGLGDDPGKASGLEQLHHGTNALDEGLGVGEGACAEVKVHLHEGCVALDHKRMPLVVLVDQGMTSSRQPVLGGEASRKVVGITLDTRFQPCTVGFDKRADFHWAYTRNWLTPGR